MLLLFCIYLILCHPISVCLINPYKLITTHNPILHMNIYYPTPVYSHILPSSISITPKLLNIKNSHPHLSYIHLHPPFTCLSSITSPITNHYSSALTLLPTYLLLFISPDHSSLVTHYLFLCITPQS